MPSSLHHGILSNSGMMALGASRSGVKLSAQIRRIGWKLFMIKLRALPCLSPSSLGDCLCLSLPKDEETPLLESVKGGVSILGLTRVTLIKLNLQSPLLAWELVQGPRRNPSHLFTCSCVFVSFGTYLQCTQLRKPLPSFPPFSCQVRQFWSSLHLFGVRTWGVKLGVCCSTCNL